MRARKQRAIQPRHIGKRRKHVSATVDGKIRAAIEADARKHGVSMSWVQKVNHASIYGIELDPAEDFRAVTHPLPVLRVVHGGKGR